MKRIDLNVWGAPSAHSRTIYRPVLRDRVPDEWSVFDFPVPEFVTGRRGMTTVPTQALYIMNSQFIVEQSKNTAARLLKSAQGNDALIRESYALILNRTPNDEEEREAATFLQNLSTASEPATAIATLCQALFASPEFRCLY